jgi:hypothetical protein
MGGSFFVKRTTPPKRSIIAPFPWLALLTAGTLKVGTRRAEVHQARNDFWSGEFRSDAGPHPAYPDDCGLSAFSPRAATVFGTGRIAAGFIERCFAAVPDARRSPARQCLISARKQKIFARSEHFAF